ncbi:MAG TPA: prenyltransferase/squalene oxidase repeat-containing protein [Planctomycetota bacterium]|jgi:geranylgeranyl transferase type-2 subunit beta
MSFLNLLRDQLREGIARNPPEFREKHARWLLSQMRPEGGFANRRGQADLYYTAFAVRSLSALNALPSERVPEIAGFLRDLLRQPEAACMRQPKGAFADAVMAASWWDVLSVCEEAGGKLISDEERSKARLLTETRLGKLRRPDGGWAKTDIDAASSVYHSFLATSVYLRMDAEPPEPERMAELLTRMAQPDGGFLENQYSKRPGTNGTAAGVMLSTLLGQVDGIERHGSFLAKMQSSDGGFFATPSAPLSDLLSTYSGLFTLKLLGQADARMSDAALRYARGMEARDGGYVGFALETTADCEYTFYGLGVEGLN